MMTSNSEHECLPMIEKPLSLLLATNHLFTFTGSELTVYTLAKSLSQKGQRVTVYAKYTNRDFIKIFEGIASVHDQWETLCLDGPYDVAYVQHNTVAIELRHRFSSLPLVYASLGVLPFLEQPPFLNLNVFKYLAISEEVRKNLIESGIQKKDIAIFRNVIDASHFIPRKPLNSFPSKALIYSYKIDAVKAGIIHEACKALGIDCRHIGELPGAISQEALPGYLNDADIVFSLGRGAIETMMCGRIPIVYDHLGGDGLVTPENMEEIVCNNFSGRRYRRQYTADELIEEIRLFKTDDGPVLRKISAERFGVDQNIDRLITVLHEAHAFQAEPLTAFEKKQVQMISEIINVSKNYGEETQRLNHGTQVHAKTNERPSVKVSIIIPVFNKVEYTKRCIESLNKNTNTTLFELIIIDNASSDGTRDFLRTLQGKARIITNQVNLGFSKACNQGLRAATTPYVLFLNNDTEPQPGWLEPLVKVLDDDPCVAAVGSKLLFPDRTIQHAGVVIALHRKSGNICPFHVFYKEKAELAAANRTMEYAVCTGACLITRSERLHWMGGFDEGFWNGYEDVDLCLRFCQNGWRVVYQPQSVVIHYESQSGPERFSKEKQNIELLQSKWRNKVPVDVIINPDGKISPQKGTRIKLYTGNNTQPESSEPKQSQIREGQRIPMVPGLTSIIVLTFNQLKYTRECVESIRRNTSEAHEIIFVDNGSTDGTVKWLKTHIKQNSNYRLIENRKNLGFSRGCNQGIEASFGEYILLLNNDVVVAGNWLGRMLTCLNSAENLGIVGPMTNNISGPQKVPEAGYASIDGLAAYAQAFWEQNHYRRVYSSRIVGFCMLFKRHLVEEIGLFDERFGSGNFEDDDYCLRAALAGYRNVIAGDVFIHHYGSRSFIGNRMDYGSSLSENRKMFNDKWSGEAITKQFGSSLVVLGAIHRADEYYAKGQMETALSTLLTAMKQAPGDKRLYFCLVEMLIDAKRYQEALEILESMPPGESDTKKLFLLGCCEEGLGRADKAEALAEQALDLDPVMTPALNLKGVVVYKRGGRVAAERFFKNAIASDPGYGESYTNLGALKWDVGEQTEALALFERGFIRAPTSADAVEAYHAAVTESEAFARAEPVFREARALHPNDKRIAFFLIATLIQQQKHDLAMCEIELAMSKFGIDEGILSAALDIRSKIGPHEVRNGGPVRSTLSLCMIVKDEERHLLQCLLSAKPLVNEMIIVDTGSSDKTKAIAVALGAKVFDFPWPDDFSSARNFSIANANGDWILVLDADEVLSTKDHAELRKLLMGQGAKRTAYRMTTRNYTDAAGSRGWVENDGKCPEQEAGRGWFPSSKVRLFPKHPAIQFVNPVHEVVEPSIQKAGWQVKDCKVPIHHYGKLIKEKVIEKGKTYYKLGLEKIEQLQGDYHALKELAIQASEIGEYEEAVKIWQDVLALKPGDASALMNAGYAHLRLKDYTNAIKVSKKAMDVCPESREAALNYSAAELMGGNPQNAVRVLEHLLREQPDYPPAMGRLAAALIVSGLKKEGMHYLDRLKEKRYDGAMVLEEQAQEFYGNGQLAQAAALLEVAQEKGMANDSIQGLLVECREKMARDVKVQEGGHASFNRMPRRVEPDPPRPALA